MVAALLALGDASGIIGGIAIIALMAFGFGYLWGQYSEAKRHRR